MAEPIRAAAAVNKAPFIVKSPKVYITAITVDENWGKKRS
jgi:hypothetical protein